MAKLLKLRRGTTSEHNSFTGAEGEVTVDTTKDTLVVHDGSTQGGVALAKESDNLSLIDEDNMASNSATRPPSQQSVKAYVDALPTVIDEDNMASDSATRPPSQQSVKAYVDAVPDVIDEDDMASDSATRPPSQQSVKAYAAPKASPAFTGTATGVNLTLSGDLTVNGSTTTVNSATLNVTDKNIVMAKGAANDAAADGGGITVESGGGDKTWNWVDATDAWTSSEHVHIPDNKKILIGGASGTVDGCELYHNGTDSYITNTGTGNLIIKGDDVHIQGSNGENMINCNEDGSVDISYNNVKKLTTYTTGIEVHGSEGSDGEIYLYADEGDDDEDNWKFNASYDASRLRVMSRASGSWTANIECNGNGNVELNHAGTKKAETTANGLTVSGTVSDTKGDLRKIPVNTQGSAYTLVAGDAGKFINASGNITVPPSVFAVGEAITIYNSQASTALSIIRGSGVSVYNASDATDATRTLAGRGIATILNVGTDTFVISGAGLT